MRHRGGLYLTICAWYSASTSFVQKHAESPQSLADSASFRNSTIYSDEESDEGDGERGRQLLPSACCARTRSMCVCVSAHKLLAHAGMFSSRQGSSRRK